MLSFEEAVDISAKDLMNYSDEQIRDLADKLNIPIVDKEYMVRTVAEKIILTNADSEMLLTTQEEPDKCRTYLNRLNSEQIKEKSKKIYEEFREYKNSVGTMKVEDLNTMFKMYDDIFFNGEILEYLTDKKYSLKFQTGGESTFTTESVCGWETCSYIITIPVEKFKKKATIVGGKFCKDQLECLQRAMEHEIVHLIIFMFCKDETISDQHGRLYMNMVSGLFGHKDYKHFIF
jgi:hypothetical protein